MVITKLPSLPVSRVLLVAGFFFATCPIISGTLLVTEWLYGNGDGIWSGVDIRVTTLNCLFTASAIFAGAICMRFGPNPLRWLVRTAMMVLFLLLLVEMACRMVVNGATPVVAKAGSDQAFERPDWLEATEPDEILGLKARPNWQLEWVPVRQNVRYPPVCISTDSLSRRITPQSDNAKRTRYALFLGCSYTYGDGVSDDQTLPYYFQRGTVEYQSYNYGFIGHSPLHTLARLQQTNLKDQLMQQHGIAIFTLINDHLDRVIPASRWIEITKGKFPYLDEETMQTRGTFDFQRKLYTRFVLNFESSGLKQVLKWGYPKYHTPEHDHLLVRIIRKSRDEYVRRFDNQDFYLIIFPGNPVSDHVKQLLKEARIHFFDYSGLISMKEHMLGFDGAHPDQHVYEAVANQLSIDLNCKRRPARVF